jgi:hypothetical protein
MEWDAGGYVCADGGSLIGAGNPATRFCRSPFSLSEVDCGELHPNRLMGKPAILANLHETLVSNRTDRRLTPIGHSCIVQI